MAPHVSNAEFLVETSALAAILLEQPEALPLAETIAASRCVTVSTNVFETVLALSKHKARGQSVAYEAVSKLIEALSIDVVPFAADMIPHAVAARARYGRSRKGLNMGDCLSYAAAKQLGLKLLYTGEDFAATDVND